MLIGVLGTGYKKGQDYPFGYKHYNKASIQMDHGYQPEKIEKSIQQDGFIWLIIGLIGLAISIIMFIDGYFDSKGAI